MIVCPNCKNEIQNDNAKFCVRCGYNLSTIKLDKQVNEGKKKSVNNNVPKGLGTVPLNNKNKSIEKTVIIASCAAAAVIVIVMILLFATGAVKFNLAGIGRETGLFNGNSDSADSLLYGEDTDDNTEYEMIEKESETETTTEEPVKVSSYSVYFDDVTWGEAVKACQDMGGHLVTIDSEEEYNKIMSVIAPYDKKSVFFLGGWRSNDSYDYYWIDKDGYQYGSAINEDAHWLEGEPSFYDESTGTAEVCMMMYYNNGLGCWIYNDVPENYLYFADYKRGRVAYICEFE